MRAPRIRSLGACVALLSSLSSTGCYLAGHHASPWAWGGGARIAPGFVVGDSGSATTVHPVVGYTYLKFDGGHHEFFDVGGQIRHRTDFLGALPAGSWIGSELAFSRLRTSIDDVDASASANGVSLTALGGGPIGASRWGPNFFAGLGLVRLSGVTGVNFRVGFDFQPWFFPGK